MKEELRKFAVVSRDKEITIIAEGVEFQPQNILTFFAYGKVVAQFDFWSYWYEDLHEAK